MPTDHTLDTEPTAVAEPVTDEQVAEAERPADARAPEAATAPTKARRTTVDPGTAGNGLVEADPLSETRTEAGALTEDVGGLRAESRDTLDRVEDLHGRSIDFEWQIVTRDRAKSSVRTLLADLADLGFGWRDIARMVGVSVPAVQKWRRGEKASGDNRFKLASLLAACDLIAQHYMIDEIASWFEVPLTSGAPITHIDLYADSRADLVFASASGHDDPESLLTQYDPDWREHYRSDFEVVRGNDGNLSIQPAR